MSKLTAPVLKILSDRAFHSGEAMAQTMGVSRQAVSHALKAIDSQGIALQRVRGKGYRLVSPLEVLDATTIESLLPKGIKLHVQVHKRLESTNLSARDIARTDQWWVEDTPTTLVTCEEQTKGRGRMGRSWQSSHSHSLTFSLLWKSTKGVATLSGLSLAVAVALVEALHDFIGENALPHLQPSLQLKWPNDLMLKSHTKSAPLAKLGGILIETEGDLLGPTAVVIGVGINLNLNEDLKTQVDQPIAALSQLLVSENMALSRNALLATLSAKLVSMLNEFSKVGFTAFRERWIKNATLLGSDIQVRMGTGEIKRGSFFGIDETGALEVKINGKLERVLSGELSSN
jgi:BirA family transcriptional regulator, biotin operon repressor / biotin---[acetyl-CoA-carboxylase] ligase